MKELVSSQTKEATQPPTPVSLTESIHCCKWTRSYRVMTVNKQQSRSRVDIQGSRVEAESKSTSSRVEAESIFICGHQIPWWQSRGRVNFHVWTSSPMVAEWRQSRFSLMDIMSQWWQSRGRVKVWKWQSRGRVIWARITCRVEDLMRSLFILISDDIENTEYCLCQSSSKPASHFYRR